MGYEAGPCNQEEDREKSGSGDSHLNSVQWSCQVRLWAMEISASSASACHLALETA